MADLNEGMWNFVLQPQQTYLHYHSAYGHQTWQGDGLPWATPTYEITWPFDQVVFDQLL